MIVFIDQHFLPEAEAKISIFDRGFLIGDGVYATIQVREGIPLFLNLHLSRLKAICHQIGFLEPQINEEIIHTLIEKNEALNDVYRLRVIVTGGMDPAMRLPKERLGHVIATLKPHTLVPYAPLRLGVFPYPVSLCHASFKSLAHFNRYYVMQHAYDQGFDDCITLNEKGEVLEAAFGNLAWIVDKTVSSPDPKLSLHYGVTLTLFLEMLKKKGFHFHPVKAPLGEIPENALVFRTNSMGGVRPIASIGEKHFARDLALEKELLKGYEELCGVKKQILRTLH